jgi:hypothetical protein
MASILVIIVSYSKTMLRLTEQNASFSMGEGEVAARRHGWDWAKAAVNQ